MRFALVGNQNCGKTTLFNQLTGSNQHVGNFPGVTVDSKSGNIRNQRDCTVVDLPGIYSIRPYTNEEIVTRDFILQEKPDGIINIIDATNIERNLYLTLQLLEMRIPTVVALNMMDEVRSNGGSINVASLSEKLGVPVIPISAAKNEGIDELIKNAVSTASRKIMPKVTDFCSSGPVHRCVHAVSHLIEDHAQNHGISPRFAATKIIEGDSTITKRLELNQNELDMLEHSVVEMEQERNLDRNAALADMRYAFIERTCADTVKKCHESKERRRSLAIDKVLTGKYTAIPLFLLAMLLIFYLTFDVIGAFLGSLMDSGIGYVTDLADKLLTDYGINEVVHSLIIDGIFAGVGSVLSFLPEIVVLFFFLSVLEDSGYMARIAFVMDKPLRKLGLSGRSIVPMLVGFGCSVPAIMSTRTLSSDRDRKMTMALIPFMSCSAKIPIYVVFTKAFFPQNRAIVMLTLYLLGIIIGILTALISKCLIYRGNPMPFVMELPNYRMPSPKSVLMLMYEKAKDFVQKAFTLIFVASIVVWVLQTFDVRLNVVANQEDSMLALMGKMIAPIFAPVGFGDWRISTAVITGLTAKETVVSTLSVLLGVSTTALFESLPTLFTTASTLSFLTFVLLYTPCVAAISAFKRETSSTFRTIVIIAFQCVVAWIVAFGVYNIALLF